MLYGMQGRPRHGVLNDNRLLCKSRYKKALRNARVSFAHKLSEKLANKLLHRDVKSFWSNWNAKLGLSKNVYASIDGNIKPNDIACGFANHFEQNFYDSGSNVTLKDRFYGAYNKVVVQVDNVYCNNLSVNDVKLAISTLKKDNACGLNGVTPEIIIYVGDFFFAVALTNLSNANEDYYHHYYLLL